MGRPKGCVSTNKYTQEQADELDRSVGAIPIGKYINSKTTQKSTIRFTKWCSQTNYYDEKLERYGKEV